MKKQAQLPKVTYSSICLPDLHPLGLLKKARSKIPMTIKLRKQHPSLPCAPPGRRRRTEVFVLGHPPIAGQPALTRGTSAGIKMHQHGAFWSRRSPAPHKLTPSPCSIVVARQVQAVKPKLGAKASNTQLKGKKKRRGGCAQPAGATARSGATSEMYLLHFITRRRARIARGGRRRHGDACTQWTHSARYHPCFPRLGKVVTYDTT